MSVLDENVFNSFFDDDLRLVKEHEFRRAVFRSSFIQEIFGWFLFHLFLFFVK